MEREIGVLLRVRRSAQDQTITLDGTDIVALLQGWMAARSDEENRCAIVFADLDKELKLPAGSAARLLETAAAKLHFFPDAKGPNVITFRKVLPQSFVHAVFNVGQPSARLING
jgi:hypothetical protein